MENDSKDDSKLIDTFTGQIESWFSYFKDNNLTGRSLKNFLFGNQWDSAAEQYYRIHNKVPMTVNKLYAFVMQLIGEVRQMSPNLKITPKDYDDEDYEKVIEESEFIEDILKSIAYNSKTDIVYETAYKNQLEIGYGAIFVSVDYRNEDSFDQEIKVVCIEEPESCYWDSAAKESDKSDGEVCGVISYISIKELEKKYDINPDDIRQMQFESPAEMDVIEWINEDTVTIADHYVKEWHKKKICKLSDGSTVDKKDVDKVLREKREKLKNLQNLELLSEATGRGVNLTAGVESIEVVDERDSSYCTIKHYRLLRDRILEENEWPSKYLPLIYVEGDSWYDRGKQITRPFIKFAVDTQKFINYLATETISYIRGGRKERFLATTANVEKHQQAWKGVDNDNMALLYDPDPQTGGGPTPIAPLEIPASLLQQYQRAEHDLFTILGRYEPAAGARSNEIANVAIKTRISQQNTTAFIYPDNLLRAQSQLGRVILDLIPTIYDTYRTITLNKEGVGKVPVEINKLIGKDEYENQIKRRDYDVEITAGSSFTVQKAESYAQLIDLISRIPEVGKVIPDLVADNLELSNTPQIVKRIKDYVIPNIAMEERGETPPPPPPNPQAMMMQSVAQAEQKKADASLLSAKSKMITAQSNMRKDFSKNQADKIQAAANIGKAKLSYQQELIKTEGMKLRRENDILKKALKIENE